MDSDSINLGSNPGPVTYLLTKGHMDKDFSSQLEQGHRSATDLMQSLEERKILAHLFSKRSRTEQKLATSMKLLEERQKKLQTFLTRVNTSSLDAATVLPIMNEMFGTDLVLVGENRALVNEEKALLEGLTLLEERSIDFEQQEIDLTKRELETIDYQISLINKITTTLN